VLFASVLFGLEGCGPGGPLPWHIQPTVERPPASVVLFLVDGLPPARVEEGCRTGTLPNIRRRFYDGGTHVRHATTSVPSITYAAIATMLTGVGPGQHGVVGNRWFDPAEALYRNYATIEYYDAVNADCRAPTVYERLGSAASVNVQTALRRGVTYNIANWTLSGVMWFFEDYTAVDKLTATSVWETSWWVNLHGHWPSLLTLYFPGLDSVGHRYGPQSPQFERALRHVDHQVGRVCNWLEREGLLTTTYLILVSDHGMITVDTDGVVDLGAIVREQWGRRPTSEVRQSGPRGLRRAFYDRFDTVVNSLDGRCASLHFRSALGWDVPPTPQEVADILHAPAPAVRLWNLPAVELVAYLAGPDEVVLRSAAGEARIVRHAGPTGPLYAYRPSPTDVLGYLDDSRLAAFVAAGPHDSRAWLRATAEQRLPDVVPHLLPLLTHRRAGQVVLFAKPGYSFVPERGGHGGLDRAERLMTFALAGPGIPAGGTIETARAADVAPTILDRLGIRYAETDLEGVSLLRTEPRLERSAPPSGLPAEGTAPLSRRAF